MIIKISFDINYYYIDKFYNIQLLVIQRRKAWIKY